MKFFQQIKAQFGEPKINKPHISIVVIIHNMVREAKRTLYSLSSRYQEGIKCDDYEVIVVDNGSHTEVESSFLESLEGNFSYYYIANALPSPAQAVNYGVTKASGEFIGIMIDGARMLTPGILKYAKAAMKSFKEPIVATLGWHLGPDVQNRSILAGYDKEEEDGLLASIDWPNQGYKLFEIASLAESSKDGWFLPISESNCLFMSRSSFRLLDGLDERFDLPGGGLVNLDLYERACRLKASELVMILGEGSFHQIHGGVATNIGFQDSHQERLLWKDQYVALRKKQFSKPDRPPTYIGHIGPEANKWLMTSLEYMHHQIKIT